MGWVSFSLNILLCSEVAGWNFFGTPSKGDKFPLVLETRVYIFTS